MTHIYDWGLRGPHALAINCPRCGGEARFEATFYNDDFGCRCRGDSGKCTCLLCGYGNPHLVRWPDDAYFTVDIDGMSLWAWDRDHAIAIRDFIDSTTRDVSEYPAYKLSLLHLPNRVLQSNSRLLVVKRINQMLDSK